MGVLATEAGLIKRSQIGDKDAFEILVTYYQDMIWKIAWRFMGQKQDAEDVVQEILLKAYVRLPGFRGESAFSTWLYSLAANACKDALRRRNRNNTLAWEEETMEMYQIPAPDATLNIQEFLNLLPLEQRLILVYRDVMGFSYEEIAHNLGIGMGTVKSRLSRARANLRKVWLLDKEKEVERC